MFTSLECPFQCDGLTPHIDTPCHILECKSISQNEDINHIYGTIVEQETIF